MKTNKFWARKVGQSINGQVKVVQVEENKFNLVFLMTERVLGFATELGRALDMANEHERNAGLAPKRSAV